MVDPSTTQYNLLPTVWIVTPKDPQPSEVDTTNDMVSIAVSTTIVLLVILVTTCIFVKNKKPKSTYELFQNFGAPDSIPLQTVSRDFGAVPSIPVKPVHIQLQPASPEVSNYSDHGSVTATRVLSTQIFANHSGYSDGNYGVKIRSLQMATPSKESNYPDHKSIIATRSLSARTIANDQYYINGNHGMSTQGLQVPAPTYSFNRNTNSASSLRGSYLFDMEEGSSTGTQAVYDKYGWTDSQTTLYSP